MSETTATGTAETNAATFDEVFDCHVINLARTPQRMAAFLKRNGAAGVAFRRFEAIDGSAISEEEAIQLGVIKPRTKWETKGTIGVALSHRNLWDKAIADQRSLIILEDDAYVRHDLKTALMTAMSGTDAWDIVMLGYNTDSLLEVNVVGDFDMSALFTVRYPTPAQLDRFALARNPAALFGLRHAFGICGYAISPHGAARLRELVFPMDNRMLEFPATQKRFPAYSIDGMMNAFYREMRAYACVPPLVLAPNDKAGSTVMKAPGPGARRR